MERAFPLGGEPKPAAHPCEPGNYLPLVLGRGVPPLHRHPGEARLKGLACYELQDAPATAASARVPTKTNAEHRRRHFIVCSYSWDMGIAPTYPPFGGGHNPCSRGVTASREGPFGTPGCAAVPCGGSEWLADWVERGLRGVVPDSRGCKEFRAGDYPAVGGYQSYINDKWRMVACLQIAEARTSKKRWLFAGGVFGAGIAVVVISALAIFATAGVAASTAKPVNSSPPTISGTPQEGKTLTANRGTWDNTPTWGSVPPGQVGQVEDQEQADNDHAGPAHRAGREVRGDVVPRRLVPDRPGPLVHPGQRAMMCAGNRIEQACMGPGTTFTRRRAHPGCWLHSASGVNRSDPGRSPVPAINAWRHEAESAMRSAP